MGTLKKYKNDIKNHIPKGQSRYHQGMFDPKKCKKYFGDCTSEPIIYRSGLERDFIDYCESSKGISKWASEPFGIKYISRLDLKEHTYYPDYVILNTEGERTIVEVKPYEQTKKPKAQDTLWLKEQWVKNLDKWNAAKAFAKKNNMKFVIITEKFFY